MARTPIVVCQNEILTNFAGREMIFTVPCQNFVMLEFVGDILYKSIDYIFCRYVKISIYIICRVFREELRITNNISYVLVLAMDSSPIDVFRCHPFDKFLDVKLY
jgi:hypothetical protein